MKKLLLLIALCCGTFTVFAQYTPGVNNNVTLLSHWNEYNVYSNIWGWTSPSGKEYALVGHNQGTSIVDITDPTQPIEVDMISGPGASGTIWREIKTYKNYAYVVSEHTQPSSLTGIQIIDLSYLPDSAHLVTNYRWPGVTASNAKAHTVSVNDSLKYLLIQGGTSTQGIVGGDPGGIRILSLASPEAPITVATLPQRYAHDTYVRGHYIFASNIYQNGHVDIWDISDLAHIRLAHSLTYPNGFSHNAGISENNRFLYTTDEMTGATVKTWRIENLWDSDTTNDGLIELQSEYIGDATQIAHNIHVKGDHAYLSHYAEGVKVLDLTEPADPVEVGYYDTYEPPDDGFVGVWGVFPYFPSGNFVVSDIETGLYVLHFDEVQRGEAFGKILDAQTGDSIDGAKMHFIEANKTIYSDENGNYDFKSNKAVHNVLITRLGYLPLATTIDVRSGTPGETNITLEPENAFISLSRDSIGLLLDVGNIVEEFIEVNNTGTGTLRFSIDDITGAQGKSKSIQHKKMDAKEISHRLRERLQNTELNIMERNTTASHPKKELQLLTSDPSGDAIGASMMPDIAAVYGEQNDASITLKMQFYHPIDIDSTTFGYGLDTDQDPTTGATTSIGLYYGDIGAEYDIFVTIPPIPWYGIPAKAVLIFNNTTGGDPVVIPNGAVVNDDSSVTITLELSSLNNDDGNINLAGSAFHWADSLGINPPTSLDFIPNEGHAALGYDPVADLQWITLNNGLNSIEDSIVGIDFRRIFVTFNAEGLQDSATYRGILKILSNDPNSPEIHVPLVLETNDIVGVTEHFQPFEFSLGQNYPNPFNPTTEIKYSLATPQYTTLKIYNLLGEEVATLVDNFEPRGIHMVQFDASKLSSGMYFYTLTAGNFSETKKLILMK